MVIRWQHGVRRRAWRNEMGVLWQIDDILFSCSILVEARAQSPMTFSMPNFLGSIHTWIKVWAFVLVRPWRETGQAWVKLRVGGFVMPRTHAAVPQSARARAAFLSGRKRGTTTGRALKWLTMRRGRGWEDTETAHSYAHCQIKLCTEREEGLQLTPSQGTGAD